MSKHYMFLEHGDASYYGRGPWSVDSVVAGWLKMVPENPMHPGQYVFVDPIHFHETFREVRLSAANSEAMS